MCAYVEGGTHTHVQCPKVTVHHTTQEFTHVSAHPCHSLAFLFLPQGLYSWYTIVFVIPSLPGPGSLIPHWYLWRCLCSSPHRSLLSCPFFSLSAASRTHCKFPRETAQLRGSWNSESSERDRRLLCVPTHSCLRGVLLSTVCFTETHLRVLKSHPKFRSCLRGPTDSKGGPQMEGEVTSTRASQAWEAPERGD